MIALPLVAAFFLTLGCGLAYGFLLGYGLAKRKFAPEEPPLFIVRSPR